MTPSEVLVVRETPSLADSVQLLLETVGFRVLAFDSPAKAFSYLRAADREPPLALVVVCNRAFCETLRVYPAHASSVHRSLPVIVVGRTVQVPLDRSPGNVRFVALPLQAKEFLALLDRLASAGAPPEPPPGLLAR